MKNNGNVAGILGNGGSEVALLQIIEAKRGRKMPIKELIQQSIPSLLKENFGYEISKDDWDKYFA